jgi:hypothetical protein
LPKAADRFRAEFKPRAPARLRVPAFVRALAPRSRRGVAGAALVAVMIGIVVNALALQHGRRIDPAPDPAPVAAVRPLPPVAAMRPLPPAPVPAPRPSAVVAHAEKGEDLIAGLLRAQGTDKRKLTLAAQNSLARLGYPIKATGALDADTKSALAAFEKAHKLPLTNEITPKLVKSLSAAADE